MKRRLVKTELDPKIKLEDCQDTHYYGFLKDNEPWLLIDLTYCYNQITVVKWDFQEVERYDVDGMKTWVMLLDDISSDFDECWVFTDPEELHDWVRDEIEKGKH